MPCRDSEGPLAACLRLRLRLRVAAALPGDLAVPAFFSALLDLTAGLVAVRFFVACALAGVFFAGLLLGEPDFAGLFLVVGFCLGLAVDFAGLAALAAAFFVVVPVFLAVAFFAGVFLLALLAVLAGVFRVDLAAALVGAFLADLPAALDGVFLVAICQTRLDPYLRFTTEVASRVAEKIKAGNLPEERPACQYFPAKYAS